MPRVRTEHRMRGRYRLHRVRTESADDDAEDTVIEYSTGTDSDEDEEIQLARSKFRHRSRSKNTPVWRTLRDVFIIVALGFWLVMHVLDYPVSGDATWRYLWNTTSHSLNAFSPDIPVNSHPPKILHLRHVSNGNQRDA